MEKKREEMSQPYLYNKNVRCSFWLKTECHAECNQNWLLNKIGSFNFNGKMRPALRGMSSFCYSYHERSVRVLKRAIFWSGLLVFCAFTVWSLKHQCFFFFFVLFFSFYLILSRGVFHRVSDSCSHCTITLNRCHSSFIIINFE